MDIGMGQILGQGAFIGARQCSGGLGGQALGLSPRRLAMMWGGVG
jgi:hypothetical protein